MKVFHVLGSIERSGAEVMLRQAAPDFSAAGIEFIALATGASSGQYVDEFNRAGIRTVHAPFKKSLCYLWEVRRIMNESKCDVVHVHTERAAFWYELVARLAGVKRVVRTVHSTFEFTGNLRLRRSIGRRTAQLLLKVTHVFISDSVARNESERFGTRGVLIPNFVDEREFYPAKEVEQPAVRRTLGLTQEAFVLVSVGRCTSVKNHSAVLRALAGLRESGIDAVYLHVGSGPDEAAERELASELGVAPYVRFMGELDDVRGVLIAADVFVMPSLYEGVGNAALEAAACCLPLVVSDSPGLRDLVEDGIDGALVKDGTPLEEVLLDLWRHPLGRLEIARAGVARVREEHSRKRWTQEHMRVYGAQDSGVVLARKE